LRETDTDSQRACLKHIAANDILGFQKVNTFSVAAMMGKSQAMAVAANRFDMWMDLEGKTLIQICNKTNDTDSVDVCLDKLARG